MRLLVLPATSDHGKKLIENFRNQGYNVWVIDSRRTEEKVRNFIKLNPLNFEALTLGIRIASPEEIHYVFEGSILKTFHLLLAGVRTRKIVFYFKEKNKLIDEIGKILAQEFKFQYESMIIK